MSFICDHLFKNHLFTKVVFSLLMCLCLSACKTTQGEGIDLSLFHGEKKQTPARFSVCSGYGCAFQSKARLSAEEWNLIRGKFSGADDAAQEREAIAAAIALLEDMTGQKTGTHEDKARASIFGHDRYQMDCVDEAINTSLYLDFIESGGLLKWHDVALPLRRGHFIDGGWPHNTAAIREKKSGQVYAVDSWYGKNGDPPGIVPAEIWLSGWRPEKQSGDGS